MSILIPSTEPGVLEDIGSLLTYNPAVEAYEDCERAMEHDGDAWREVWPDKLYLYNQGDECTDITGGWSFGNGIWPIDKGYKGSLTKKADCMVFVHESGGVNVGTNNKIDLSPYKKLRAKININTQGASAWVTRFYHGGNQNGVLSRAEFYAGESYISADIKNVNESCYVSFDLWSSPSPTLTIYEVWLE